MKTNALASAALVDISVASRTGTADPNDWPVNRRSFRLQIACLRDSPIH